MNTYCIRLLLIFLFLFSGQSTLADKPDHAQQCNAESEKENINKPQLTEVCLQAAKQAEADKDYNSASWYYLLAGEIDYLTKEMPQYIDKHKSTVIYANIGHGFVLNRNFDKAEEMYWSFLTVTGAKRLSKYSLNDINKMIKGTADLEKVDTEDLRTVFQIFIAAQTMDDDYATLKKLYPPRKGNFLSDLLLLLRKSNLERGLETWQSVGKSFMIKKLKADRLNSKCINKHKIGQYKQALDDCHQAREIYEAIFSKQHSSTAANYHNIAEAYYATANYSQALTYYKQALASREKILGKEHPDTVKSYNSIVNVNQAIGG